MSKKMLIDATHEEETRVAVVENNRLVDFDYESAFRKQLKGSIFLAKVTRVEPSLQAAFVNFGGNRHGFLPFSEIHPDYFRIPIADREALLAEQEEEMAAKAAAEEAEDDEDETAEDSEMLDDGEDEAVEAGASDEDEEGDVEASEDDDEDAPNGNKKDDGQNKRGRGRRGGRNNSRGRKGRGGRAMRNNSVEVVGGDGIEGDQPMRPTLRKNYKIQEVVKRGQIMLIQVSKEERGNKGAAVTSYLSLPGRYCVLMPNSPRAGGVSRKIANYKERKRMREILQELNVPQGMSVIMRTAGVSRTKAEIKRDLDYLLRLWDKIRKTTLESSAPAIIHEEGRLILRSVRDIYTREIDEVIVAGKEGHKTAKDFMKMLIPSHAKKVTSYEDDKIPLFNRYQIENQINEIGEPVVTLPSGGYLVINPTEALVSVDVNSGRATKERHIEETALRTNLEAAAEVARQLKLRDLGGLVVIDFIDMETHRNNRKVENKIKEALSGDRARIQIGRISTFGLMELSRQRLNPSLTEAQFEKCQHCDGIGHIRSVDSTAIIALRALEEEGVRDRADQVCLKVSTKVALFILNNKRKLLADIEERYGFTVSIETDDMIESPGYVIEPVKRDPNAEDDSDNNSSNNNNNQNQKKNNQSQNEKSESDDDGDGNKKRGGRRGRRGGRGRRRGNQNNGDENSENQNSRNESEKSDQKKEQKDDGDKKSQSPKSGGRGRKKQEDDNTGADETAVKAKEESDKPAEKKKAAAKKTATRSKKASDDKKDDDKKPASKAKSKAKSDDKEDKKPARSSKSKPNKDSEEKAAVPKPSNDTMPEEKDYETVNAAPEKKKKGWWNRIVE